MILLPLTNNWMELTLPEEGLICKLSSSSGSDFGLEIISPSLEMLKIRVDVALEDMAWSHP